MSNLWRGRGTAHVLGDNVPHDGGVINFRFIPLRITDPNELIPHLFDEVDPTLKTRLKPGDFIVAGDNFCCGKAHTQGLIALKALNIRILCQSMPYRSFRAATGLALPAMIQCSGITSFLRDGDEIEVDFASGAVVRCADGATQTYPGIAPDIRTMIEEGGMKGLLAKHLREHPELAEAYP